MKMRLSFTAIAVLLIFGLASCGEESGPANDPAVAAGVMGSATPMCITPGGGGTGVSVVLDTANFIGSRFEAEVAGLDTGNYSFASVTFTNHTVAYNGKSYTLNGTLNLAFEYGSEMTSPSPGVTRMELNSTAYSYASGFTIAGDDYDASFDMDCRQVTSIVVIQGGSAPSTSVTITTTGLIAGHSYDNAVISATY